MLNEDLKGKVVASPEILGAQLSDRKIDIVAIRTDAKSYIESLYGVHVISAISIVENDSNTIHLSLPYYDGLELMAESIKDEDLVDVDGAVIGIIIAAIVAAVTATATVVGVATYVGVDAANNK